MEKKLIYILGPGHCGSTILEIYIANYNNVFSLGEVAQLDVRSRRKSPRIPDRSDIFDKFIGKQFRPRVNFWRTFLLVAAAFFPFFRDKEIREICDVTFDLMCQVTNVRCFTDGSKEWQRLFALMSDDRFDLFVLYLYRKPSLVHQSYTRKYQDCRGLRKSFGCLLAAVLIRARGFKNIVGLNYDEFLFNQNAEIFGMHLPIIDVLDVSRFSGVGGNRLVDNESILIQRNSRCSSGRSSLILKFLDFSFFRLIKFFKLF